MLRYDLERQHTLSLDDLVHPVDYLSSSISFRGL